jgi:hypothetical protein
MAVTPCAATLHMWASPPSSAARRQSHMSLICESSARRPVRRLLVSVTTSCYRDIFLKARRGSTDHLTPSRFLLPSVSSEFTASCELAARLASRCLTYPDRHTKRGTGVSHALSLSTRMRVRHISGVTAHYDYAIVWKDITQGISILTQFGLEWGLPFSRSAPQARIAPGAT